jgi:2-methylcitrate dehydratase PrpD
MNAMASSNAVDENADRALVTAALAELGAWAVEAMASPLPEATQRKAALVMVDDLAAMSAAHSQPELIALRNMALINGYPAEATIFAPGGPRTDKHSAAVINGTAGCWCELDEGYRGAPCHGGLYVLPALMSEAERHKLNVEEVLKILAISYEVAARVAEAWTFPGISVHPHAAFGNFGAAAAAGLARGVSAFHLASALRIVGAMVPAGAYQAAVEGALVRNLWTGQSASMGMSSVDWALAGIDGYRDGPHQAFQHLFGATLRTNKLTDDLGKRWALELGYHKLHGCCHSTHSAVETALKMRTQLDNSHCIADMTRIDLFTHRPTMSNTLPSNSLAARFSFEHVVAVAWVQGHTGPSAFEKDAIDDTTVAAVRNKIRLLSYTPLPAWPMDRPARLEICMNDGSLLSSECLSAPGGPDQPLTTEDLMHKITLLTNKDYPNFTARAREIVALDLEVLSKPWSSIALSLLSL